MLKTDNHEIHLTILWDAKTSASVCRPCNSFRTLPSVRQWWVHTCQISHCEIKSHRFWPIWKPIPIRFFKSHRIFRPSYNTFYEEINLGHSLLCLSRCFLHLNYMKGFWLFLWSTKMIFVKISEFYQISLKNLPYLTDFSPHLMLYMWVGVGKVTLVGWARGEVSEFHERCY